MMRTLVIAAIFIWCGLLIGISFMEAPLKFQAPNITLELGLGIGKLVFTALNRMECFLAILISISFAYLRYFNRVTMLFAFIAGVLVVQTFYLLPILNERVLMILAGKQPPASNVHLIYVILEVVKLLALLGLGFWYAKKELRVVETEM